MAIGIIKSKEAIGGNIVTAEVETENGETKKIFADLTSIISVGDYDNLDMCEVGDKVEFFSSYIGSEYGEALNYINVMK